MLYLCALILASVRCVKYKDQSQVRKNGLYNRLRRQYELHVVTRLPKLAEEIQKLPLETYEANF
ncbi:hypothetical protein SDC9_183589 [bioreactor metagenome]|uniref:Uncharacterized protein n=1 Tax=bioreactor metagenome TaxID=1076179 RepID=A0A645HIY6_9ZZZZ